MQMFVAGGTKSHPSQSRKQNVLEVKGPLFFFFFFSGASLKFSKTLLAMSHSFDCDATEMVLTEARFHLVRK